MILSLPSRPLPCLVYSCSDYHLCVNELVAIATIDVNQLVTIAFIGAIELLLSILLDYYHLLEFTIAAVTTITIYSKTLPLLC